MYLAIRGKHFDKYWQEIGNTPLAEIKRSQGEDNALFKHIRQQGLAREFPLVVLTLKALSKMEVRVEEGKIVGSRGNQIASHDLSREVSRMVNVK